MMTASWSKLGYIFNEEVKSDIDSLQFVNPAWLLFCDKSSVREVTDRIVIVVLSLSVVVHVDVALRVQLCSNKEAFPLLSWIKTRVGWVAMGNVWLNREISEALSSSFGWDERPDLIPSLMLRSVVAVMVISFMMVIAIMVMI